MGRRRDQMDDVERQQTAPLGLEILQKKKKKNQPADGQGYCCCMIVIISLVVTFVCVVVPIEYYRVDADYSVGIDATSGAGLDTPMMTTGLSFNLTVGIVISHSHVSKACVNPGMYTEVYYHGVQLAASTAEAGGLCAQPGNNKAVAEKHVLAMATAVPVGHVMNSLVDDMKKGAAVFDVALHIPAGSYGGMTCYYRANWVSMCHGRRVGDKATLCDDYSPHQEQLYA